MILPKKKTKGNVQLKDLKMLLIGPPKIGKSTVCSGFADPIFLATEKGYAALKVFAIDIKTWEDFKKAVKLLTTNKAKNRYKNIIVDTIDILCNLCNNYICNELGIKHISDMKWAKGYDMFKKELEIELNKLCMLDVGIILISHTKIETFSTINGDATKITSTLNGSARSIILPKVSLIGYMHNKLIKPKIKGGRYTEKRVISFEVSEFVEAGDRDGKMPAVINTFKNPKKTYELFKKYYGK